MPRQIDWSELGVLEGFETKGYVPLNRKTHQFIGKSGVTIGYGVDLGQRSAAEIKALPLPSSTIAKLMPYALLKGYQAADALRFRPLQVSVLEARMITAAVWNRVFDQLAANYNARSPVDFDDLPKEAQNVLASMALNFGPALHIATPNTFKLACERRWKEMSEVLKKFPSKNPELSVRRYREGTMLHPLFKGK